MPLTLLHHPAFAEHDTGEHPERLERYGRTLAALEALAARTGARWAVRPPAPIADAALERVHPASHTAAIEAFCRAGGGRIDEDTVACSRSLEVARLSAGAAVDAVDAALATGEAAISLGRPPGHHALPEATMGFCFFNNAALAARHAQAAHGLKRVAILDWDLHHGNGTEAIFYDDPDVLYLSCHQSPNWPGTGASADVGRGAGAGATVNLPLPIGTGDAGYARAFEAVFAPVLEQFAPELLILSAGYDAHWRDPLGRMGLSVEGFARLTAMVRGWAERGTRGGLVVLMEGGYDLEALAASMAATVATLADVPAEDPLGPSPYREPAAEIERAIAATRAALAPYYPALADATPA